MDKHQSKIIIFTCIVVSIISLLYLFYSYKTNSQNSVSSQKPSATPPMAFASQALLPTVESSDGNWKITMKEAKTKENTTYTFSVINEADSTSTDIFTQTVPTGTTMSIPDNTFSPDDKYLFLRETGAAGNQYLVLTLSGENITKDAQTLEISSLFAAKYQNYKITDVTGWGGMNLIVFNTDKVTGGQGPSFWFEVPSKAIIQLSNRFN